LNHKITLYPSQKKIIFPHNTLLLDILKKLSIDLETPCGGKGFCRKCLIMIKTKKAKDFSSCLACQIFLKEDLIIKIDLPKKLSNSKKIKEFIDQKSNFALALDLGTTTIQISLVNLTKKKTLLIDSFLNPQKKYGYDVISRIAAAQDKKNLDKISYLVIKSINRSLIKNLKNLPLAPKIKEMTLAGNTTMTYLLLGLDPSPLGQYPYKVKKTVFHKSDFINLTSLSPKIFLHPVSSAFIGGDVIGGIALLDQLKYKKNIFFIDLGTNGEICLIDNQENIYASSSAMGPALEGMNISCGMLASQGAINHFWEEKKELKYSVIESNEPKGICGTGLIDLLSLLLKRNIITKTGLISQEFDNNYTSGTKNYFKNIKIIKKRKITSILLFDKILLSQQDIRNIQLAKGASLATSYLLFKEANYKKENISHVIISGTLGKNLNIDNFKKLKFIPNFKKAKFHLLGNTSLQSAELSCLDPNFRKKILVIKKKIKTINLANHKIFAKTFLKSLNF